MSNVRPMDVVWRVSSRSNGTACIEVARSEAAILVRDTKNRGRGILTLPLCGLGRLHQNNPNRQH